MSTIDFKVNILKLSAIESQQFQDSERFLAELTDREMSILGAGAVNINSDVFIGNNSKIIGKDVNFDVKKWASLPNSTIAAIG
jgi:hypothetical protein